MLWIGFLTKSIPAYLTWALFGRQTRQESGLSALPASDNTPARYAVVVIAYNNNSKVQKIFIRQGDAPDFLPGQSSGRKWSHKIIHIGLFDKEETITKLSKLGNPFIFFQ